MFIEILFPVMGRNEEEKDGSNVSARGEPGSGYGVERPLQHSLSAS
jgi:hypothetical protein